MPTPLSYCDSPYAYMRRTTRTLQVGNVSIGSEHPLCVQSMITSDTLDTESCVAEIISLAQAGCQIARVTAQTKRYAQNLEHIVKGVRQQGYSIPLVADIHFKPDAAFEAAQWVEKIRINPGNYADKKKFKSHAYTKESYQEEIQRIRSEFAPLVTLCKQLGRAMRIGTNHGSLSDRIMSYYGDTPLGMVESALEFARIAREQDYHNFCFSMKASNPKVMIAAYRLLVARLKAEGDDWNYPIHLGVTEAGDGEDGRIKSSIGIGSLLSDGIGDTLRVSLTEDALCEIPVAKQLARVFDSPPLPPSPLPQDPPCYNPFEFSRRLETSFYEQGFPLGSQHPARVAFLGERSLFVPDKKNEAYQPEIDLKITELISIDPRDTEALHALNQETTPRLVTLTDAIDFSPLSAFRLLAARLARHHAILLKNTLNDTAFTSPQEALITSSILLGSLLCDGIGEVVWLRGIDCPKQAMRLSYNILQAAGMRLFKTDFVACPSCGRTLFNLQETTQKIREATGHLKGVRIAIMGCIVNGPGEMADADFGYVGGAPHKINLYVGKQAVQSNIPENEAVEKLIALIDSHGKWTPPPSI